MNDTKIRILAALFGSKRFTVVELCERTALRRSQVDPVLATLKKEGFVEQESLVSSGLPHRPSAFYKLSDAADKQEDLANQLYGLRKAIMPSLSEEFERLDLDSISWELDVFDLLLDICNRATKKERLQGRELKRVETQFEIMYRRLERVTYSTGLDLRDPANQHHPLSGHWTHWHKLTQRIHEIINRWRSASVKRISSNLQSSPSSNVGKQNSQTPSEDHGHDYSFRCSDAGFRECKWETHGSSVEEVMRNAEAHGRQQHGLRNVSENSPSVQKEIRSKDKRRA